MLCIPHLEYREFQKCAHSPWLERPPETISSSASLHGSRINGREDCNDAGEPPRAADNGQRNREAPRLIHALEFKRRIMRKLHIAISTDKIEQTIADYSARLGVWPCANIPGEYALWRTESLNVSVRQDPACEVGSLRHLGWEDSTAPESTQETDVNGIVWERFTAQHQANEINQIWPETHYQP